MDYWPKYMNGGVWIPLLYLLAVYPCYMLFFWYMVTTGSGIMDDFLESIGNVEVLISGAIAFVVVAFVIYFLLRNEYASTKKKKYAEQLAAVRAGAEVDQLVLDQYASFDRTYTLVMVPAIVFGAVITETAIIGLSLIWAQFSMLAVDIVAAVVLGGLFGLVFEKAAQACADGNVTGKYTDKILAKINEFRQASAPAVAEKVNEAEDDTIVALAGLLAKLGKSKE